MTDRSYNGNRCIDDVETAWQRIREMTSPPIAQNNGLYWAIRRTIEIARSALALCPVQPGDCVEIARRVDCSKTARDQANFEAGHTGEVVAIDLDNRGYTAALRFYREYWTGHDGERHEIDPRHIFPNVPVKHLRKLTKGRKQP